MITAFLKCVIEGKVQYLISDDRKHLLPLKEYEGMKILFLPKRLGKLLSEIAALICINVHRGIFLS